MPRRGRRRRRSRKLLGDYERASFRHGRRRRREDEETLRKLAALGYAGGRTSHDTDRSFRDLPDPKDRIGIYNLMNQAREAIQDEHDDTAAGLLREVLRGDPEVIDAYFMLGNLLAKKHEWREAADLYRKTLEKRPDHDYAMIGLADTLVATGRVDDAILGYDAVPPAGPRQCADHLPSRPGPADDGAGARQYPQDPGRAAAAPRSARRRRLPRGTSRAGPIDRARDRSDPVRATTWRCSPRRRGTGAPRRPTAPSRGLSDRGQGAPTWDACSARWGRPGGSRSCGA